MTASEDPSYQVSGIAEPTTLTPGDCADAVPRKILSIGGFMPLAVELLRQSALLAQFQPLGGRMPPADSATIGHLFQNNEPVAKPYPR